ncbi:hypothetical protein BKA66DRAFT_608708 [Pyrenochaeta sp. MPI-SDFR-AT-0127]|nr:hypothetical protein BKA66DRAFT_608708 [Pyrenochaeta sp. MPI-SDFR-AT-0127]
MASENADGDIEMQPHATATSSANQNYHELLRIAIQREVIYTDDLENITPTLAQRLHLSRSRPQHADGLAVKFNLAGLQRITLHRLQRKLLQKLSAITANVFSIEMDEARLDEIKGIMSEYTQAVRDWDLMIEYQVQAGKKLSRDLFLLSSQEILSHATMQDAGFDLRNYPPAQHVLEKNTQLRPDLYPPQRRYVNRDRSVKAFWKRFLIALFGGLALVVPMLIMKLHEDRTTALATTSIAVLLFAVCIATFSNALPEFIVSAVAAYAAVLVVFVGVSK